MKNLILLITAIFILSSCSHNIPIANIEFTKIEKDTKSDKYYNLYFSSDIELINNLQNGYAYTRMDCFLENENFKKNDFVDFSNIGYALTSVGNLKLVSKNDKYKYRISVFFDNNDTNSKKEIKVIPIIKELLKEKPDCLSCVISAVAFMSVKERYTSNTMCLPKSEINKVME